MFRPVPSGSDSCYAVTSVTLHHEQDVVNDANTPPHTTAGTGRVPPLLKVHLLVSGVLLLAGLECTRFTDVMTTNPAACVYANRCRDNKENTSNRTIGRVHSNLLAEDVDPSVLSILKEGSCK